MPLTLDKAKLSKYVILVLKIFSHSAEIQNWNMLDEKVLHFLVDAQEPRHITKP